MAQEAAAAYAAFQKGWMANRRLNCDRLLAKWQATGQEAPKLTAGLARDILKIVRTALAPVLPSSPMFVLTDYATAKTDSAKGRVGLTSWAATFRNRPVESVEEWWHDPTCPKTDRRTKASMFLYAKYCNADWIIAPVMALLLRRLLPWKTRAEAHKTVAVMEHPVYPSLPVYQFMVNGEKKFMRSKDAECFNILRVGPHTVLDVVRGIELANKAGAMDALRTIDVDLAIFLLYRNAKARRLVEVFDQAIDQCQRLVFKRLRDGKNGHGHGHGAATTTTSAATATTSAATATTSAATATTSTATATTSTATATTTTSTATTPDTTTAEAVADTTKTVA
jgi:hypothetical protein